MKLNHCAKALALLTLALGGIALPASAQTYNAKFTLPCEAVWNNNVLEPGEYTISANVGEVAPLIRLAGNGVNANILALSKIGTEATGSTGRLLLTEVDGRMVVTRFSALSVGLDFEFSAPKHARNGMGVAASRKLTVPVSAGQ